ncbi:DnaT-like ssDNA-binding protein [Halomonas sp. 5021]|uniref:DnaT-like ssDNA-binding protein n=1 Tax=Halomonas sp. 5021 TaxID=3082156 RepID=UPI002FC8E3DD
MSDYITVAKADELLGAGWQGDGDADQAVMEANVWLSARNLPDDPVPSAVERAGALLAKEAAKGELYASTTGSVKRKRVKADTVESETEYTTGDNRQSGTMRLVLDLLRPWLSSGSTFDVRRA